ncbi:MAG: hypothetical protein V4772_24190 [Pseudomonadota bacterium]
MNIYLAKRLAGRSASLVLAIALILGLSACGGGGGGTSGSEPVTNPGNGTPVAPADPGTSTTSIASASASGSITSNSPQVTTFSPKGSAERNAQVFTTVVNPNVEVYTFQNSIQGTDANGNSAGLAAQIFEFKSVKGKLVGASYTEVSYQNRTPLRMVYTCGEPCTGLSARQSASGNGIVISLQNVKLAGDVANSSVASPSSATVTFNGVVTGEMTGGFIFANQLPRSSSGSLNVDGSNQPVLYGNVDYPFVDEAQRELFPTINMVMSESNLRLEKRPAELPGAADSYTVTYEPSALVSYSASVAASVLETTATGYRVRLNNLVLKKGGTGPESVTVNNTIAVGRPTGSLSALGEADFKPLFGGVTASDDVLQFDFSSAVPKGVFTRPGVQIDIRNGEVVSFTANANSGKSYFCDGKVSNQTTAKCSGTVTLSADKRSLTFTGFTASVKLKPAEVITFNGVLTAAGL